MEPTGVLKRRTTTDTIAWQGSKNMGFTMCGALRSRGRQVLLWQCVASRTRSALRPAAGS